MLEADFGAWKKLRLAPIYSIIGREKTKTINLPLDFHIVYNLKLVLYVLLVRVRRKKGNVRVRRFSNLTYSFVNLIY